MDRLRRTVQLLSLALAALAAPACTTDLWVDDRPDPVDCPADGIRAASCELPDLQAAADSAFAAGGGTVCIPAGACAHADALRLSDGVSLHGAGADHTVITDAKIEVSPLRHGRLDRPFRITGLGLVGSSQLQIEACRDFRLDHLRLEVQVGGAALSVSESRSGLVDHCSVSGKAGLDGIVISQGYDVLAEDWLPDASPLLGADTAIVLEDNQIGGLGHAFVGGGHAHVVARYNTFTDHDSADGVALGPAHGPPTGCRLLEVYGNRFRSTRAAWEALSLTSGSAMVFENAFEGYDNGIGLHLDTQAQDHPVAMRPHGVWIWDNQFVELGAGHAGTCPGDWRDGNASCNAVFVWDTSIHPGLTSAEEIQEDRDYWLRAPASAADGFVYTPLRYPHPFVTDGLPPQ